MVEADKKKSCESRGGRRSLRHDTKGAVLAEFVVAIFPLLAIFFVFVQLSTIAVASLMVKHATVVGARAAAVFSNAHQNVPEMCGDNGEGKVRDAVTAALGPWSSKITTTVRVTDNSSRNENDGVYDLVTVQVTALYRCNVPLGKMICPGGVKTIIDTKSMSHQGARYKKSGCSGGGGGGGGGRSGGGGGGGSFGGGGAGGTF